MFDAEKFVIDNHIDYEIRKGWVNIQCPFCGDTDKHLGLQNHTATCWRCGKQSIYQVIKKLGGDPSIVLYSGIYTISEYQNNSIVYNKKDLILPGDIKYNKIAKQYIENRNFDIDELIRDYKIQFTNADNGLYKSVNGSSINYKFRIMIPIFYNNKLVSWTGRSYVNDSVRYLSLSIEDEIISHKTILYNECDTRNVIVVEGLFDAIRIGRGAVCTFGTAYTKSQVLELTKYNRVFILFDNEIVAQKQAESLAVELNMLGVTAEVVSGIDTDPADLSIDDVKYLREWVGV